VAQKLGKPLSVFKSDMSYKMGQPFDGYVNAGERIIVVDDIASDAQMLLNPIRHLHFYHAVVKCVVTLLERIEGDARLRIIQDKGVPLHTICRVDDEAIEHLITRNAPFQCN
jgi:orotate phosphoribosyltransferase